MTFLSFAKRSCIANVWKCFIIQTLTLVQRLELLVPQRAEISVLKNWMQQQQDWPRRAEARSRSSRLEPRAEMSDSAPWCLGASGLALSTQQQQAGSAEAITSLSQANILSL